MGAQKDTMVLFAEREIRQIFSGFDGWKITPVTVRPSAGNFYRVSRSLRAGDEVAFIGVSFDPEPKEETVRALDNLTDSRIPRTKKFILMPREAGTEALPSSIQVLPMTAFAFAGKKLVWLTKKKNAKRVIQELPVEA
jgi:hypothetical protein